MRNDESMTFKQAEYTVLMITEKSKFLYYTVTKCKKVRVHERWMRFYKMYQSDITLSLEVKELK